MLFKEQLVTILLGLKTHDSKRDSLYMRISLNGHCKGILFWRCSSCGLCGLYTRRLEYIIDGKIEAFKIE